MAYVGGSRWNPVNVPSDIRDISQARQAIQILKTALNDMASKLNAERLNLERSIGATGSITIVGATSSGGGSSGGIAIAGYKAQSANLVAGSSPQIISFSLPISSKFIFGWRTYNTAGDGVGVQILPTNITATGFTVTDCVEACTIEYWAIPVQ